MFGSIGFSEILVLAAVGLLVLGPEQFPKYAKMAARFVRDLRTYANEVQTEITKELNPLNKDLKDLRKLNPEKYLEKLIAEDEADTRPPNPEPHPSEMNFGTPAPAAAPAEADTNANAATVTYGGALTLVSLALDTSRTMFNVLSVSLTTSKFTSIFFF